VNLYETTRMASHSRRKYASCPALSNDAASNSDCVASNEWMAVTDEVEGNRPSPNLRLEGLGMITIDLIQNSWSILEPSPHEARVLPAGLDVRSCFVFRFRSYLLCFISHETRSRQKRDSNGVFALATKMQSDTWKPSAWLGCVQPTKGDTPSCNFGERVTSAHDRFARFFGET
jgi:hypothetical protein